MGLILAIIFLCLITYYFIKRSQKNKRNDQILRESIERDHLIREKLKLNNPPPIDLNVVDDESTYKAQVRRETQERMESEGLHDYEEGAFDIFNDPYVEPAAKDNRNSPIILTFIYEKHDKEGNVTGTQERAVQPYMKDEEYLEGYCLDREERRTFRIDRIVRFTGNSEAIFDGLD